MLAVLVGDVGNRQKAAKQQGTADRRAGPGRQQATSPPANEGDIYGCR